MQVSTTVAKTKKRPFRFIWFGPDGVTPNANGIAAMSSDNNSVAQVSLDPNNNRRAFIVGINEGTATITIGSGSSPLIIDVTVTSPPDLTKFELEAFEPEE